ncbi:hypothetical protein [Mucisphaera sp.]|uniref:hypothetical protein n=1 Tax=Mucisphaera sp. TaxID=2913024 RepID=UPI003D118152
MGVTALGWFERLCRNAGLAVHHVAEGLREKPDRASETQDSRSETVSEEGLSEGERVQRVRRVTIEEVEIRTKGGDNQKNPSSDRDEPPQIA